MIPKDVLQKLPKKIFVRVIKGKTGCFIAEVPEYDIFTEADNQTELLYKVNDLIYTFFDIPRKSYGKIVYLPPVLPEESSIRSRSQVKIPYEIYFGSDLFRQYCFK